MKLNAQSTGQGEPTMLFVHGFPREQKKGQYAPYEGIEWPVPTLMLGIDEGETVKKLAAAGGSATLTLTAEVKRVKTRMLLATLPGVSDEKVVIQSHTDGMNALWDNGPIAMLALARYFGKTFFNFSIAWQFFHDRFLQGVMDISAPERLPSARIGISWLRNSQ